ncbi:MAG: hypothetical protein EZS28_055903, partial [Streblomastix strix]
GVHELTAQLDEILTAKNRIIEDLKYEIIRVTKAHNDAIHVMESKLLEMGIPEEDLGYRPTVTSTVTSPAGLVSALI